MQGYSVDGHIFQYFLLARKLKINLRASRIFKERRSRRHPAGRWELAKRGASIGCQRTQMRRFAMLELILLDSLRLLFAFGICGLVIWFWYWFFESVGTF